MQVLRLGPRYLCAFALWLGIAAPLAAQAAWPVEVEHAYGTTVVPEKPLRVATVNWSNHEVPLALGVVPVGMAAANFGDDDGDGVLPWVTDRLDELGAEVPVLFDEGDGIDFEAVAAAEPDVILAAHSGLSEQDYQILSQIAPTVAYPDMPWTTEWRQMIRMNSAGMGMAEEGEALIADLEAQIAAGVAEHPVLAGKSAIFVTHLDPTDLSRIPFYTDRDTRVAFLHDLGLVSPEPVKELSATGRFAGEISSERIDALGDVDIVVTYGSSALVSQLGSYMLTRQMPAVSRNSIVLLNNDPLGTAAHPSPLAIPYVLDAYLDLLSEAAAKAE
ncbi:iron-siderophore ABC transporter substrate-binding protein [Vannielia litorea]|uniref:iron-siderophore ABC transporter substrate-binding protein n=1 Tax=Vannielia litorea TaxID=1217970 RepID=UPI001C967764|nr:iron-siderophore ABC transporter substrate-binding protein [Vannielia litorea]MBY6046719.1 iron-siderophore ABC transporter substrate-binding protein [Vannielia litorea]MBY6074133.1 iron-siderophore ABC transporter substrate-binding protein [Vannielia litorea]